MIYAEILAGGKGTRMGNTEVPKQFLKIGSKPILIHTLEQFILHKQIDEILVVVPKAWLNNTKDIIKKYIKNITNITVIEGGKTRNETVMRGIEYIDKKYGVTKGDIIITHDAVRPFVSYRIIEENIKRAKEYGATDTVIPAVDTIVISKDHDIISEIPIRDTMYQGQTPQTFNIQLLLEKYRQLNKQEAEILTDAAKIMTLKGQAVKLVMGETYNIKITTQYDLLLANSILEGIRENDQ